MSERVGILLDEHAGRVIERVLREHGYHVEQSKDRFGERTTDRELLEWCGENGHLLVTNNAKDFDPLHDDVAHTGLFLYRDQRLPDDDPEGLARTVREVLDQYGVDEIADELVELDEWHDQLGE